MGLAIHIHNLLAVCEVVRGDVRRQSKLGLIAVAALRSCVPCRSMQALGKGLQRSMSVFQCVALCVASLLGKEVVLSRLSHAEAAYLTVYMASAMRLILHC